MLINLDFLKVGATWPPVGEGKRLKKYEKNRLIFEGEHEKVYQDSFKRITRVIGNFEDVVSYSVITNYQKLVSLKIADFLLGEPPKISCGDDESKEQTSLDTIIENSDLFNVCYSSAIDISRFGDSILNVYQNEEGKGIIDITQPSFYFKVVDPKNIRKVQHHVLAHTYRVEKPNTRTLFGIDMETQYDHYLYVEIHSKGFYEKVTFKLNEYENLIIGVHEDVERVDTGLDDFAILPIHNLMTSDRIYGIDDYTDLDSIISEIEVRISQISKILDKHAEPSVQGPSSALFRDMDGQWKLKMGNYFPRDNSEDPPVEYITWDAQLQANFQVIEKLVNILAVVSEMGSAIFDSEMKVGQATSGTALRRMMISPLAKVSRVRMNFDTVLKKALKLCSQLGGEGVIDLTDEKINIFWNDGLPDDPMEQANLMALRTGNKATLSQYSAIQRLDNLSDEDTEKELMAILQDEKDNNPLSNMNFDYGKSMEVEEIQEDEVDEEVDIK